ncbi:hypothetical protein [Desulfovibrio sp. TomC]|uniref:hypothetical protein n=1 Tax=Desulfovibrio sp. TomC TaxID=1562888 RepID=UPI000575BED3|nr:hypothetical protein [Desulfovibrio sp. TomC]KHK04088.1 ADP-L-glycero-D-manno-heptose-6-epimerase [Desulfovibrio sp. TomC]
MIIVTGGAGFLGSARALWHKVAGPDDIMVVDNLARGELWRNLVNRRSAEYLRKDVLLAAIADGDDPFDDGEYAPRGLFRQRPPDCTPVYRNDVSPRLWVAQNAAGQSGVCPTGPP